MDKFVKILKNNWKIALAVLLTILAMVMIKGIVDFVIPWSNKNQGFIMLLMMITFIVTILILIGRNNPSGIMEQKISERRMPVITSGMRHCGGFLSICVRNEGSATAAVLLEVAEMQKISDYYTLNITKDNADADLAGQLVGKLLYAVQNRVNIMPGQELIFEISRSDDKTFLASISEITISCNYSFDGNDYETVPSPVSLLVYNKLGQTEM